MEEQFNSRRRRKSSFFRKSIGVPEIGDQSNIGSSEFGLGTSCTTIGERSNSSRDSEIASEQVEALKAESKQWKEYLRKIKTQCQVAKSDEQSFLRWIREGECFTNADRQYLESIPDYNGILAKFENLKGCLLVKAKAHIQMEQSCDKLRKSVEMDVLEQKPSLLERISTESLIVDDTVKSLNLTIDENDDSGCILESQLSEVCLDILR